MLVRKSKPVDGEVVKQVIGKLKKRKSGDREGWRNEMIQMGFHTSNGIKVKARFGRKLVDATPT